MGYGGVATVSLNFGSTLLQCSGIEMETDKRDEKVVSGWKVTEMRW